MEYRRATPNDITGVDALREGAEGVRFLFDPRQTTTQTLVSYGVSSVVALTGQGEIQGFVSTATYLQEFPLSEVIASVQDILQGVAMTPGNTVLLTALVVSPLVEGPPEEVARALLEHALTSLPEVEHLLILSPPSAGLADYGVELEACPLAPLGCVRTPVEVDGCRVVYLLPSPSRPLLVRDARVEDFDDLAPVFEAQSEVVQAGFGEYFLAEVIEQAEQDPGKRVLVGERGGKAVGLLSVTASIPVGVMLANFDTEGLGELTRPPLPPHSAAAPTTTTTTLPLNKALVHTRQHCSDWVALLTSHAKELPTLFSTLPAAAGDGGGAGGGAGAGKEGAPAASTAHPWFGGARFQHYQRGNYSEEEEDSKEGGKESEVMGVDLCVFTADFVALFNDLGDAWGYAGPCDAQLGTMILVDTGLCAPGSSSGGGSSSAVVSVSALEGALSTLVESRRAFSRLATLAKWYNPKPAPPSGSSGGAGGGWVGGFTTLTEAWERATQALDTARKERFRALQAANTGAGREVEMTLAVEKSTCEGAAKEAYEREKAEAAAAAAAAVAPAAAGAAAPSSSGSGGKATPSKPPPPSKPVNVATLPVPNTPAVLAAREARAGAEARAEAAGAALLAVQATLTAPLTISLMGLLEFCAGEVATAQHAATLEGGGGGGSGWGDAAHPFPREDLALELTSHTGEGGEQQQQQQLTLDALKAALRAWERTRLARVTSPVIVVTSCDGEGYPVCVPPPTTAANPRPPVEAGEGAVAAAAARLLSSSAPAAAAAGSGGSGKGASASATSSGGPSSVPVFHLPALMERVSRAWIGAVAEHADACAKAAAIEEKRRKAEDEAAKAKEKGGPTPPVVPLPTLALTPAAAAATLAKLGDPTADPLGALTAYLTSGLVDTSRGFVLSGLPYYDAGAVGRLGEALSAVGLPITLHLHAETKAAVVVAAGAVGGGGVAQCRFRGKGGPPWPPPPLKNSRQPPVGGS